MSQEPFWGDFEYHVRIAVSIPVEWAAILKQSSANHYDHRCREAGEYGVVNGLYNVAQWNAEEPGSHLGHPISWSDADLMAKIMEQPVYRPDQRQVVMKIHRWLQEVKQRVAKRLDEIIVEVR